MVHFYGGSLGLLLRNVPTTTLDHHVRLRPHNNKGSPVCWKKAPHVISNKSLAATGKNGAVSTISSPRVNIQSSPDRWVQGLLIGSYPIPFLRGTYFVYVTDPDRVP